MSETEREKRFKRVAGGRVEKVLYELRRLSKCSNTRNYLYTQREVNKMFRAIDNEIRNLKTAYRKSNNVKSFTFDV
jgi:hypothetical protein|tara:strand:+ start:71 stop:298 length:228 start_codon:yes stop_codon:yes gene_type:complete